MSARYADTDSFVYVDPPESRAACLACKLVPDCNENSPHCGLKALGRVKKIKPAWKPAADPNIKQSDRLQLSTAIKAKGTTVHEWCRANNIKYDQLVRYEHAPPTTMTPLRSRIEKALQSIGIVTTLEVTQ
ncbi:hypothetical protein [Trichlorobacter lovleyi]|uniref:Uncharacterized protein n=1 Tax=Trichlorobacter lovleyi (strain ATCC BAA-1151 / DSM 17278 / SZ) TaxID=398767 RepID=B3E8L0_TRIL1|nr:hypothetical protein [Trichlorobacter lovleyi]ACD96686.1 hypothetical protein Glov_2980 [Trichlorobacter lovleyi SZ]